MGMSRPSRPVLLTTAATAGALVLTALAPGSATADPTPRPVTREGSPLDADRAAKARGRRRARPRRHPGGRPGSGARR